MNIMNRFLYILIVMLLCTPVFSMDLDDFVGADRMWDGQKSITNKEFEDAINVLQQKQKKKEAKQKNKKIKKISGGGTSLHSGLDPMSEIKSIDPLSIHDDEGLLLNVPVNMVIDGKVLDKGYYNVYGERDKESKIIYLTFYQAHYPMGKVKAKETNDDYDDENINFVRLIPYNDRYIKILFGSMDFNAYAFVECMDVSEN